ncbi:hypothetical protein M422DRAFT_782994 [Sphaerobolus stellatus SS14]|uniref:Uncharacterized protein n=1 Tax=Sphaerobolus stellatus (strain SS14) TaxID=990650 RepID=A0A0C9V9T3_SPHS4|nr:hypothetical protein M422DRAFT_782994 [Sphaerobolus stellatus SS14]
MTCADGFAVEKTSRVPTLSPPSNHLVESAAKKVALQPSEVNTDGESVASAPAGTTSTASTRRKVQATQMRSGKGKPVAAGGNGAKVTSKGGARRARASRMLQEETIEEDEEAAEAQVAASTIPARLPDHNTSKAAKSASYPALKRHFDSDFNKALNTALSSNIPILVQYRIKTVDNYLNFHESMLSWRPSEDESSEKIYGILSLFYVLHLLPNTYQTPICLTGGWTWLSQWLVDYSKEIGKWFDTPESLGEATLTSFWNAKNYHMQNYIVPPSG